MKAATYRAACVLMHQWIGAARHLLERFRHNRWWHVVGVTFAKIQRVSHANQLGNSNPSQSTAYSLSEYDNTQPQKIVYRYIGQLTVL